MSAYAGAVSLGLGVGAVYGALGIGLVLTYRTSAVINVAHATSALFAAYEFAELRDVGDLVLPVIILPPRVHLTDHPTFGLAISVSLAMSALLALFTYGFIVRPLRNATSLTRLVAMIGLMISLQELIALQFGSKERVVEPVLPQRPVELFGTAVPSDRLLLAGIVVLIAGCLGAWLRCSLFGLASRAVADNSDQVALFGQSVDRIAAVNWLVATLLAAVAGILVAPITGLSPTRYTMLMIPALAAAVLTGLASVGGTVVIGFALGVGQALLVPLEQNISWLGQPGFRDLIPFLLVVVVAVARGNLILPRGTSPGPAAGLPIHRPPQRPLVGVAVGILVMIVALYALRDPYLVGLERSLIAALICLSSVVVTGYAGQISFMQMTITGVGGFLLARLETTLNIPFPAGLVLATTVAGFVGLLLALTSRRIRGFDLAVVTLIAGLAIQEAVFASPLITGGFAGSAVSPPSLFGLELGYVGTSGHRASFGFLILVILAVCCYGVARLRCSTLGIAILAMRMNERAAAVCGIDVSRCKLISFTFGAALAGLGGCLIGYTQGNVSSSSFGPSDSLLFFALVAIGGFSTIRGALVAGLLVPSGITFILLDQVWGLGNYQLLILGVTSVMLAIAAPIGTSRLPWSINARSG